MNEKEIMQIAKDFVEGKMDINEFYLCCKENEEFRKWLNVECDMVEARYKQNILTMVDNMVWENLCNQYKLQLAVAKMLFMQKVDFKMTDYYYTKSCQYSQIVPDWLPDSLTSYVEQNIIEKAPKDLDQSERNKWITNKIKDTFKYEKKPPMFVQEGSWPQDGDGNFLTFVKQTKDGDKVTYKFVNKKTNENIEVVEFF